MMMHSILFVVLLQTQQIFNSFRIVDRCPENVTAEFVQVCSLFSGLIQGVMKLVTCLFY